MGVILQGILGGFSGKVGPVVGGKWKDIDYMRSYVIPSNPNTAAQQAVRAKFGQLVEYGRALLAGVLQPYWDPFYSDMSGFNAWISQNYALADSDGILDRNAVMSKGTLTEQAISTATLVSTTVTIEWSENTSGNAASDDTVIGIVYDDASGLFYFNLTGEERSNQEINVTVDAGLTQGNLHAYIFATRGTGSELIVSDSRGADL